MNTETFAEWLRRQGFHVIRTASSYWYNQGPRVYQAFPYHRCIQPTDEELREFLVKEKAVALRYSTPLEVSEGKISYHVVFEDNPYDLQTLSANARSKVRRGLKRCKVDQISVDVLADEGWGLLEDTLGRQGRLGGMNKSEWRQLCLAVEGLPGFEAWGALVEGRLAASILTTCIDGVCYMLYPQSHREHFSSYVNNALSYTVSNEMVSRPEIHTVFYGVHPLDAPSSMDEFKLRMGYKATPVRQRVVFHPLLETLFNVTGTSCVKYLLRCCPKSPIVRKAEGMLQFYADGKRSPNEQEWPECLESRKSEVLQLLTRSAQ